MASKLNRWSRDIYLSALLGVLVYVTLNTCFHGPQVDLAKNSVERRGLVRRSLGDWFTALAIQFFRFFLAKLLQFRYLPVLQQQVPFMSLAFWLAFMLSNSH